MVPAEFATQAVGAAITGSTTKAIAANINTRATGTIAAVAGKCAGGKTGASENKENCKNDWGVAQH
jgi:membrane peptidoglycan carboxypeptidase